MQLIERAGTIRDKAIIAFFTESGLRLSELVSIRPENINWELRTVQIVGKGRKETYAPFGELTEKYLKSWLRRHRPIGSLWELNAWEIKDLLSFRIYSNLLHKAPGLLGSGLGSISFIFDFLGHISSFLY